jgi:hypothetical protein
MNRELLVYVPLHPNSSKEQPQSNHILLRTRRQNLYYGTDDDHKDKILLQQTIIK